MPNEFEKRRVPSLEELRRRGDAIIAESRIAIATLRENLEEHRRLKQFLRLADDRASADDAPASLDAQ